MYSIIYLSVDELLFALDRAAVIIWNGLIHFTVAQCVLRVKYILQSITYYVLLD